MSASKKIIGGIFWTTLNSVVGAVYSFFSVPILLVHYGKQQYGLIGIAMSVNVYLKLMDMGFASGNVKFFSEWIARKQLDKVNKLFQSSLVFYAAVGILNVLLLAVVAHFSMKLFHLSVYETSILKNMFYVLMISAFFGWISTLLDQFLRSNEIIGWEQRLLIISKLFQVFFLFLTIKLDYSIVTFFALTTLSALIVLPFSFYKIKTLPYDVTFYPLYHKDVFNGVLKYSLQIFSFGIFQFSAVYLRPLIVSIQANVEAVADYRIMEGFANIIMLAGTSFFSVIFPIASKVKAIGDTLKEKQIAYDATKYITTFLSLVIFSFILISDLLLQLYVGNKFLHLVLWLNLWALTLLGTHNSALSSLVLSSNNLKPIVYISAFSTVTSLTMAWYITPIYNVGGVVLSYIYYNLSQLTFYYAYYYKRKLGLNTSYLLFGNVLKPIICVGTCCLCIVYAFKFFHFSNSYFLIGYKLTSFFIVSSLTIYIFVLNKSDLSFINKILKVKE